MQPFSIGKHEHMMQVFTSRELQMAAMGPSQVLSLETEATYIACKRSIETMQVIPPMQKTNDSAIFWRFGRLRLLNMGKGAMAMPQSLKIFNPALLNHIASWFKHLPFAFGSIVRFQKKSTGTQAKIVLQLVQTKKTKTNPIKPVLILRNHGMGKTRRHCNRIDILAAERAAW